MKSPQLRSMIIENQPVQQKSNKSVRGSTTGRTKSLGATVYVEVLVEGFGARFFPEADLEPVSAKGTGLRELLLSGTFGTFGDLARVLSYHKIGSNLSNIFYAMQASRTEFHAYQFKPVYKFIESIDGRILIADEVGLGKTIEAGLIWLEAQARYRAKRLLVVCPSMLREKWKIELRRRFQVKNAEIYDSKQLVQLIRAFESEGDSFDCAAICSLQTVRQERVRDALESLESTPGRFDLVVVDEAHHMRNTTTRSHAVGRQLSDLTRAMVLLTATPIHLGNKDLFHLLKLLNPDQFEQQWQFEELIEQNEPVVRAQKLLRVHPPRASEAEREIELLTSRSAFQGDTNVEKVLSKLAEREPWDHTKLVEVGLLLEKLNLLSGHIARTRKREVVEWRVVRRPQVIEVVFTPLEAKFYAAVTRCVQERIARVGDNYIAAMALMMPQRQMASCIPAMVEHYLKADTLIDSETLAELGFEPEDDVPAVESSPWPELGAIVKNWPLDSQDSKYEVLVSALKERFSREPDAKIIVFSYFKKTLAYLSRRLSAGGFPPIVIHGDIAMAERLDLIERFRTDPRHRILLASEVGAEGIDLQFARILFNYDLPWNPMKVEQRIGRIDRLGQKADAISIVNFSVTGTIEEKILNRLYYRIGIFERSLGDLEPILGEKTRELEFDLLTRRLTSRQQDERIELTLRAAETERQLEEQLAEQSSVFLGSSDYILDQIGLARDWGRRITSDDLRRFIEDFFAQSDYYGTSLEWDSPDDGRVSLKLSPNAKSDLHWFCQNHNPRLSTKLSTSRDGTDVLVYDNELAQNLSSYELLTHLHPLVRWIKSRYDENKELLFPVAAVELSSDILPTGQYLIVIHLWTFEGIKTSKRIEYEITQIGESEALDNLEAEKLIKEVLDHGATWEFATHSIDQHDLIEALDACDNANLKRLETAFGEFSDDNSVLLNRRRQHLKAFYERKIRDIENRITTMRRKETPERQMKGFYAMLDNRTREADEELRKLEEQGQISSSFNEVAAFVCKVT